MRPGPPSLNLTMTTIRLRLDDMALLDQAAALDRISRSELLRRGALHEARRILRRAGPALDAVAAAQEGGDG
jgi:uncharacterized protein (DUF1778 family)